MILLDTKRRLSKAELARRLEQCRAGYDAVKARLSEVGFICEGSLAEIHTCCRNPNCRCADPKRRHGPYYQLTWKEAGKTVSRRLLAEEASSYREWIANRRQLESVIRQIAGRLSSSGRARAGRDGPATPRAAALPPVTPITALSFARPGIWRGAGDIPGFGTPSATAGYRILSGALKKAPQSGYFFCSQRSV